MTEITCADLMLTNCVTLPPRTSLGEAVQIIHNSGIRYLPVVDEQGNFVGIFSSLAVLRQLLPTSSQVCMGIQPNDYNFMRTSAPDLQDRFRQFSQVPVTEYLERNYIRCEPNHSLMATIFQITTHHTHAVVCERNTDRFLGIITINRIFDTLLER